MSPLIKRIPEGGYFPTGYGAAWFERDTRTVACLPLGLNWIGATIRRGYIALRHASNSSPWDLAADRARHEGYSKGYDAGRAWGKEDGDERAAASYREGWNAALAHLEKLVDSGALRRPTSSPEPTP